MLDLARREKAEVLVVLNRTRPNTRLSVEVAERATELGAIVAETRIANRVAYAETLGQGLGVIERSGAGAARDEMSALLDEVLARIG